MRQRVTNIHSVKNMLVRGRVDGAPVVATAVSADFADQLWYVSTVWY